MTLLDPTKLPSDASAARATAGQRRDIALAEAQMHAANALVEDPIAPSWTALPHLRHAWSALYRLSTDPRQVADGSTPDVQVDEIRWLPADGRERLAELFDPTIADDASPVDTDAALRQLADALRVAERELLGRERDRAFRARLGRRAFAVALLLGVTIAGLVLTMPPYREGPWRGAYYPTPELHGEPRLRRDGDVNFDWHDEGPTAELPADGFSARWDTCLELEEPANAVFQLVSDDGSRLFVDEKLVIDNWGDHAERARGGELRLEPGIHHLRVEYYDRRHGASITLVASLGGERPEALPGRVLRFPGLELPELDPCGAAEASRS